MKKILKILSWTVAAAVLAVAVLAVALVLWFDPNQHKGAVIALVKERTGRTLTIDGHLGWTFFPRLGIEARGLALDNARGFGEEPFARIAAAGVRVSLWRLLRGELAVDTLYVDDLELHLARDANGRTNWDDLLAAAAAKQPPAAEGAAAPAAAAGAPLAALRVGSLDVRNATVTWHDLSSGTRAAVRALSLVTGAYTPGRPLDLSLRFVLEHGPSAAARLPVEIQTKVLATADRLELDKLAAKIADTRLEGRFAVQRFAAPQYRFDLALDRLDLDRDMTPPAAAGGATPETAAKGTAPAAVPIPIAALRTLDAEGKLAVGSFRAFGLQARAIRLPITARGGRIRLGPSEAELYGGRYRGDIRLDARPAQPVFEFNERLSGIALGPFLRDAGLYDKLQGTGDLELALTARGREARELKRTLSGRVALALRDGKIEGVNLERLVTQARALYDQARGKKEVRVAPATGDETVFRHLTASARLTDGVAHNEDLVLTGPVVRAQGRGTADLVRETLDYRLEVTIAEAEGRRGTTVPVRLRGPFAQLEYRVELGEIVKQRLERKLEQKLERQFEKWFEKK